MSAFDIVSQISLIGLLAYRLAVLSGEHDEGADRLTLHLLGAAVAMAMVASAGILLSRTLELNGGVWSGLFADMRVALKVTHFGHVWRWRLPALGVLWLAWAWRLHRRNHAWTDWVMVIAIAGIALTRSQTGHPADHGDFVLSVWVDWCHLLAAGVWVGSLFGMSLAVFPDLLRAGEHVVARVARLFQRLSTLSGIALTVLLACGIYNVLQQLGSLHSLWTTRYGATLSVKLIIVFVMILLGAHNRYVKLPRLLRASGKMAHESRVGAVFRRLLDRDISEPAAATVVRQCAHAVWIESLLGLAVIATTAVLLHAMPPADAPPHPMGGEMSFHREAVAPQPHGVALPAGAGGRERILERRTATFI
ncbi:MAG: CopD family protein [Rhodanobacter sp.]